MSHVCDCTNKVDDRTAEDCLALGVPVMCEWCLAVFDEPPHEGHYGLFGDYFCDTCQSVLCDLA